MSILRVNKNKDYSVMCNYHLRDKNISLKAKGLLSVMLSLPDDWDYSIKGLSSINQEGMKAIRSALQELEQVGYITRTQIKLDNGQFDYVYDIYEMPKPYDREGYAVKGDAVYNSKDIEKEVISSKEQNKEDKIQRVKNLFEEFWKLYPRKVDKKGAFKAFKNIENLDLEFDKIIEHIKDKKFSKQWSNVEYIPHPTTYIHQERWKSEENKISAEDWFDNYWNEITEEEAKKKKEDEEYIKQAIEKYERKKGNDE